MSKSDPFCIIDEFPSDIQVVEPCLELDDGISLLEPGVTIKTTDDRGQEVQIQFETATEDNDDENTVELILDNDEKDGDEHMENAVKNDQSVMLGSEPVNLVYVCAEENCGERLSSKWELLEHTNSCHATEEKFEFVDQENTLFISEERDWKARDAKSEYLECMNCDFYSSTMEGMKLHIETEHNQDPDESRPYLSYVRKKRAFRCPECDLVFERKFHLARHIKLCHQHVVHRCQNCTYTTSSLLNFKKHQLKNCRATRVETEKDIYSESSVEKGINYKCVCTWCEYKSNKYSHVKKHIELYHETKQHFPCKECVFVGATVDDYAQHFNSFHKMDHYRHACTDCSFKCTNRLDLRNHYVEVHKKQRLYACRLCNYKAQDIMTIKKHISKTHSTFVFHCKDCNFSSNSKNEFGRHCAQVHGDACFKLSGDVFGHQIGQEVQEIVEHVDNSSSEPVPETEILEEQIFEEQIVKNDGSDNHEEITSQEEAEVIMEEQIEEEVISDFFEGQVMLLSSS